MIREGTASARRGSPWNTAIILLMAGIVGSSASTLALADDSANQLTLADLAAYHAALSGKATAEDARDNDLPVTVSFRDLWDRPEAFRGRRVSVRGRIERIFRQGAVGQFPALAQSWTFSPAGDPFCLVHADRGADSKSRAIPGLGAEVRFVGTFLKMVEYPAGDGSRLAPLIVGDHPPEPWKEKTKTASSGSGPVGGKPDGWSGFRTPSDWMVGLVAAIGVLVVFGVRHLRYRSRTLMRIEPNRADPPLEFVSPAGDAGIGEIS